MQVLFTPRAQTHVEGLYDYIAAHSGRQRADGYISRIIAFCRDLEAFPHRGTKRDDLLPGLRTIGFERRVVVAFVVTDGAVLIQGIFYGGRKLTI